MKKLITIAWISILVVLVIAVFTKPSYKETFFKISKELNSRGYLAGVYFNYDKMGHRSSDSVHSTIEIKDRLFYQDVYFPIKGKTRKIAVAAFNKLFLID